MTEILLDGNIRGSLRSVCVICAIYKGCGPSARLELPPDDFSRNAPDVLHGLLV